MKKLEVSLRQRSKKTLKSLVLPEVGSYVTLKAIIVDCRLVIIAIGSWISTGLIGITFNDEL